MRFREQIKKLQNKIFDEHFRRQLTQSEKCKEFVEDAARKKILEVKKVGLLVFIIFRMENVGIIWRPHLRNLLN